MKRKFSDGWPALTFVLVSGCSASSPPADGRVEERPTGGGAAFAGGGSARPPAASSGGGGAASSSTGHEPPLGGGDPPSASAGGSPSGSTEDPPPGETGDPPPGDTGDPPPGDTGDPPPGDTGDPPPGDTGDPPPGDTGDPPCIPSELNGVNVIVFEDATPSGADVEGSMYVGGDAVFEGYGIASRDPNLDCSQYGLVVGGSLTMRGGAVGSGKVSYGGELELSNASTPCGISQGSATDPIDFAKLEETLVRYSATFRDYPPNGEARSNLGTLTLSGSDPALNVFAVSAEALNQNLTFEAPAGSSVIVNVAGTNVVWQGRGFQLPDGASCRGGTSTWCSRILYNLYEAETVTLGGIGVQGSVLAPFATLDGGGGNIDGQLVVRNLTGGIEYHPYLFSGCLRLPVPTGVEP